ncbi:PE-PGRS family protein PE_PGRS16 [Eucalyptus grandis]|uniref:PE-PGRS family protein PE_PGRS16 n=1 Tax=Eucalyptus grandis TaxID=71139 RepID=UPI00192ECA04|nr:PE-PGRS family protein PE_PGRS16 [Eucalyptus grandis]
MAKGRRLTVSLSERYLGSYSYGDGGRGAGGADASELGEEDIWSAVDDMAPAGAAGDPQGAWTPPAANGSDGSRGVGVGVGVGVGSGGLEIPRDGRRAGGLSLALVDSGAAAAASSSSSRIVHQFRGSEAAAAGGGGAAPSPRGRQLASSAPVNVPDWSKIYRVDSVESLHDSDDTFDDGGGGGDAEMMPPHEYLARKGAAAAAATSVFEGVGRTLKGRDARRIRDAVWSRTGFDG